jgi:DNA-binding transcriptional LysR family regulator
MDIQDFRIFTAAAELGSFSQAAERLFLTQPAISKRIATLEEELGVRLFDRIGRQVQLTEAGRALVPRARRLLDEVTDLRRSVSNLSGSVAGTLAMGTSHHIGLHRLPPVLKAYSGTYPEVRLDIRFMDSEAACRAVERGALELAVVTLPSRPIPNMRLQLLWDDPLHWVVGRDHPLAMDGNTGLVELLAYPAVLPGEGTYTRELVEQALRARGLVLQVGMTTNYLETLKMLVVTGLGWGLLPATMLDGGLLSLPLDLRLSRRLGIVTHAGRTLSNAAARMIDICTALAG